MTRCLVSTNVTVDLFAYLFIIYVFIYVFIYFFIYATTLGVAQLIQVERYD